MKYSYMSANKSGAFWSIFRMSLYMLGYTYMMTYFRGPCRNNIKWDPVGYSSLRKDVLCLS